MACVDDVGRLSAKYGGFRVQGPVDAQLAALGAAHWAVFSLAELVELGLTPRAVQARAATARLYRHYRGVYSLVPPALLTRQGRWLAAVLACGPGAVLSHRSAAALHGLRPYGGVKIDVTVPTRLAAQARGHRRPPLNRAHAGGHHNRSTPFPAQPSPARSSTSPTWSNAARLERAFDQAEIMRGLRPPDDRGSAGSQPSQHRAARVLRGRPRRALHRLDRHLERARGAVPSALSARAGLPAARGQRLPRPRRWRRRPIRADFVWRAQRAAPRGRWPRDARHPSGVRERSPRDQRAACVAGWRPVRMTWRQLKQARPRSSTGGGANGR